MNAFPDFKPSPVKWCSECSRIKLPEDTLCDACGSTLESKVRFGCDLIDPDHPWLRRYKTAGEL